MQPIAVLAVPNCHRSDCSERKSLAESGEPVQQESDALWKATYPNWTYRVRVQLHNVEVPQWSQPVAFHTLGGGRRHVLEVSSSRSSNRTIRNSSSTDNWPRTAEKVGPTESGHPTELIRFGPATSMAIIPMKDRFCA